MRRSMILLAALLVAGCGDEEGNTSYLRVVVDGEAWSGEATEGQLAYYVEGGSGIWTIASQPSTGGTRMLTLVVPVDPAVGSYPLDQFISRTAFSICPNLERGDCIWWTPVPEDPGTLVIETIDPATGMIEGRFHFTGYTLGNAEGSHKPFTGGRFRFFAPGTVTAE